MEPRAFDEFSDKSDAKNLLPADNMEPVADGSNDGPELRPVVGSMRWSRRETRDFQLRANGKNELLEVAMPLLGLAIRIRSLREFDRVDQLHSRLINEIEVFQQDIETLGYDEATTLAARYVLCAAVDEAVLSQQWGAESNWSERPLLSVYHNETWGGEKVFAILDRVIDESHRFVDLLEFIYYVVLLGFEGKYHVIHNGHSRLEALLSTVNEKIVKHRGTAPDRLLEPEPNIYNQEQSLNWQMPIWAMIALIPVFLLVMHLTYDQTLDVRIDEIISDMRQVLDIGPERTVN